MSRLVRGSRVCYCVYPFCSLPCFGLQAATSLKENSERVPITGLGVVNSSSLPHQCHVSTLAGLPAPANYPLRHPRCHLIETVWPLIQGLSTDDEVLGRTRKLEHDRPPLPNHRNKEAEIVLHPCSNFLEWTVYDVGGIGRHQT